ncbi:MAG: prepilin-type N-terminal cleavage/methylation domain-containing protein [Proteobacteria bacterium]|nr:prepilin-type N-terminal cleavage/methylation domain-containing protein [Pseudomonadota bacterium]MBU1715170.1 prepilin-type N-terminal cleavage/methylation domain-containing protein [Pseudomonadota bacterium]
MQIIRPEGSRIFFGRQGFTLLELLISLAIMSVIVTVIFGGLRVGVRAWDKGESLVDSQQRLRIVPELVRKQIASLTMPEVLKKDSKWFFFEGDNRSMAFFSNISLYPEHEGGIVYVRYLVSEVGEGKEKLAFFEKDINLFDSTELAETDQTVYLDLLSEYTSISFDFMAARKDRVSTTEWLAAWLPEEMNGVPQAVRVTFQNDGQKPPVVLVIPVHYQPVTEE